jgi:DNA replication and repair protein RecF
MLKIIKEFYIILKQRNASIKKGEDFFIWNPQLIRKAKKIWETKSMYEENINKEIKKIIKNIKYQKEAAIKIKGIIKKEEEIEKIIQKAKEKDVFKKTTSIGPHKDKIEYTLNGDEIKNKASQGERNVFFSILKKAEANLIKKEREREPVILLDDILSKLDNKNIELVLEIFKNNTQTIITHTTKTNLPNINEIRINEN